MDSDDGDDNNYDDNRLCFRYSMSGSVSRI